MLNESLLMCCRLAGDTVLAHDSYYILAKLEKYLCWEAIYIN